MIASNTVPVRVLVADDDPIVRLLIVAAVAELGLETFTAANGAEAWRLFEEHSPNLVMLSTDLPIVDGPEMCRRIREGLDGDQVFVMFLASRNCREALESLLDAGADEFLMKPMSPELVRARLLVARRRIAQEATRRTAEEELSRARWLSGIGEATLSLQHEINNPLTALIGAAELMRLETRERGEPNELLEIVHESALRIAEVIRRLRRLKNPESVDLVAGSRMIDLWRDQAS